MKLNKTEIKNNLITVVFALLVTITLALFGLANFSMPFENRVLFNAKLPEGSISRTTVTVADDGAIVCDSIVQGVRDCDLDDGTYTFRVAGKTNSGTEETKDYLVELINYYDDVTYSLADGETAKTVSLGDTTTEYKMLVVKYHKNLTVNSGVTLTATNVSNLTYKKGMYICVMGELINRGTITMTARGTYNCAGENVYLWKNEDDTFEYVPAIGGAGGPGISQSVGTAGTPGSYRGTGGGGSGASNGTNALKGGNGAAGTSYSGGAGGGGVYHCAATGTYGGGDAGSNGGAGGYGAVRTDKSANSVYASGGAGNLAGKAAYLKAAGNAYANLANSYSKNGTGGLLTVYAESLYNKGTISSNGSNVVGGRYSSVTRYAGGGGSGGGSVNIFAVNTISKGSITANPGTSTVSVTTFSHYRVGSSGGAGTTTYKEVESAQMNFDKNQDYIGVNEKLQLNIIGNDKLKEEIGENYSNKDFSWKSTNEDVATVDENGIVTGISDGYTTIYAYHEVSRIYAMAVINVAKEGANPQIETGSSYTVYLKSNGTVWTIGNNTNGQLGNGTNEHSEIPVQVRIDANTVLDNVVKISSGTDHVLALTNAGEVYAWGLNTYGQLGQNNTDSANYAKKIFDVTGQNYLSNIVDISAGAIGSSAIDENGNVYVWGNATYGELGSSITTASYLPIKISTDQAIQVSMGAGVLGVLKSDGTVWAWGRNHVGQVGNNTKIDVSAPVKVAANVTELSYGAYHAIIKKIDGTIYAVGSYYDGRLGTGTTDYETIYTKMIMPSAITENNKVKYVRAGRITTSILLENGTVWATGHNVNGEIGNGQTTSVTTLVQSSTENGYLTDVLTIGRSNGDFVGSDAGYAMNTAVILKNGDIYTTGDNTYGQIGDSTFEKTYYYKKMGYVFLEYEEKSMELDKYGYQIDLNKLAYKQLYVNVYKDAKPYEIGELKYSSSNTTLAQVYSNGYILPSADQSGFADIKIQDTTNGFETTLRVIVNKLANTNSVTYIYDINDLNEFRDSVNAGNNYAGKTVYLMADIDMSTVCSEALGTWEPIGVAGSYFTGTFDGNYHNMSNLYIKSGSYANIGLFTNLAEGGVVQNLIMENPYVYNSYTAYSRTAAIAGHNYGTILNCASIGGSITGYQTTTASSYKAVVVGGMAGYNTRGNILNCFNSSVINGTANQSNSNCQTRIGGVCGINLSGQIVNCYNKGSVKGIGYYSWVGGVVGMMYNNSDTSPTLPKLINCYNVGTLSSTGTNKKVAGLTAANGENSTGKSGTITNSYALSNTTYSYYYYSGSHKSSTTGRVAADTLKTYTTKLGTAYENDQFTINEGYPILWWQAPTIELNKKQEYIKIGETLQAELINTTALANTFNLNINITDITWESSNPEIATVNSKGLITGIAEGYTTIYGYHNASELYAMCVINVQKNIANPQFESGEGFTVILKADGTVWTIGKNDNGELGDGTLDSKTDPVQVKINEGNYLTNVKKISVGTNHVLALTQAGEIYAWGANSYGQLGHNNKENSNYAKLVLAEGGSSYLENIIDISAGSFGSTAINQFGWTYIWGNGSYGENGNGITTNNLTPIKNNLNTSISVSMGAGHLVALGQNSIAYTVGRNTYGELGIASTTNSTTICAVADQVEEISAAGCKTVIKKIDGTVYGAGLNTSGGLANGTVTNATSFTKMTLPTEVSDLNKVKYIKAGTTSTGIVLSDRTAYNSGNYTNGKLANSSNFVQAKNEDENLENVLTMGRSSGTSVSLNTVAILENGDVYTIGDNTYGQIGDHTTQSSTYYTKMGYAYLDYADKTIELDQNGYQIDLNKLKYVQSATNVYNNEHLYTLGDLEYVSTNDTLADVNDTGFIPAKYGVSGIADVKIADVTNGYDTYFTVIVNKLENTETVTYIYSIDDLIKFRDSVNAGNNYLGKTVYLMADIDMSSACSATVDSWKAIGATGKLFEGTFDGNYHTLSNLYINSGTYANQGLFCKTTSNTMIENLIMKNPYVYNSYPDYSRTAAIVGNNYGKIINCASVGGKVIAYQTKTATEYKAAVVGGIVGYNDTGTVLNSFNTSAIFGTANTSNSNCQTRIGGVIGINNGGVVSNCYNRGSVTGKAYNVWAGGAIGMTYKREDTSIKPKVSNCYSVASLSATGTNKHIGGITATNGHYAECPAGSLTNSYCSNTTTYSYYYYSGSLKSSTSGKVADDTLKTYTSKLGTAYENDDLSINDGYPILWWQAPTVELNKKHEYISKGEELQLNVIVTESLANIFGRDISNSDFEWSSSNEEVATINESGLVTGVSDGYTTIIGKHKTSGLYAMAIVNVAENNATPQVETGEGFTAMLKADGTVWTIGKNDNGELGDGTTDEKIEAVQVKINETDYLTNVEKISVGTSHVLALTTDGKVYSWGANSYGQLGHNNKENSNYAKIVLAEGAGSELERIVDISAGSFGSTAVNQFGWVYSWGNGSYGEIGNGTTKASLTPVKNTLNTAISVSMGAGHVTSLSQNGSAYTWGRNTYGELGINSTTNSNIVCKVKEEIIEVSASGFETLLKDINSLVYGTGLNTTGALSTGTMTNLKAFTKITLPKENTVKYIKAGRTSSTIMYNDGTVYVSGNYANSLLENTSNFVIAEDKNGPLENSIMIGRSSGETVTGNTALIQNTGRVYTIGSNIYGQIGNNTKTDANKFTVMGYIEVLYPEKIVLNVGDARILTGSDFAYVEKYFNVYEEDTTKVPLVSDGKIIDSNIATYENGTILAQNIGKTSLIAKEENTETLVYIPVIVLPENGIAIPDVKLGDKFTITLKADGTVWDFGNNTYGQLGVGDNVYKNIPKQVTALGDKAVEQISVGDNHVIALTQDGKIYTWGLNSKGQLGIGNTKNSNIPQEVIIPKGTELVEVIKDTPIKVIANKNVSYAILQNGKVYAWGDGYKSTPTLLDLDIDIIDISNNYAVDIQGNVYNLETLERIEIVEKIKYISEGKSHTVFLSENNTAFAIGSNSYGQFGDGTNVSNETNVVAIRNSDLTDILRDIKEIEAGDGYTTALLANGKLVSFGSNEYGKLGLDEIAETNILLVNDKIEKLLSETGKSIMIIDSGHSHTAIALNDGNVYTWGLGLDGQLGNGANESDINPNLVGKNIIEVNKNNLLLNVKENFDLQANTTYYNLLQDINGNISFESKNPSIATIDSQTGKVTGISEGITTIVARELGTDNISVIQIRILPEGIEIEPQVQTNGSHTVTLKVDGTVWCYGNNTNGELGNETKEYSDQPVQAIFPEGTIIVQIASGENFSLALDSEGNVWAWGANDYYQLGNSYATDILEPTKIEKLRNITKIATGTYSCLAIDVNKDVFGWGLNSNGELGIGTYTNKVSTPTKAKYITDIIDIAIGKNHSIILKSTGEVYVSGLNLYGQLGNNDTSIKKVNLYTKVEDISAISRISTTDSGNIVVDINGKVYSWGLNIYGELGLGDKINKAKPQLVENIENIVLVSGGRNHSILLDRNGKIYTTGSNKYGMLGNGTTIESLNYIEVPNIENIMTVSAGNTYTAVAKTDGTVWGFGDYNHGDRALKSKTCSTVPIQVGNDNFGLAVTEIVIKKSETVSIAAYLKYSFNLIYLNLNYVDPITYESLNEEIAMVNQYGEILGVREGFTWIKAIEKDGKEHIIYVYVTDNEAIYAPKISAGEDFAVALKSDGTMWTFGHNNNGELGIGSNRTKDIPEKTNVITTYKQISSGESFTIAIRTDGTVWSYGKNNYGQLGIGTTKNGLNPVQTKELTDIVQIAAGKAHGIALDSYGILYGWGNNSNGQLGLSEEMVLTPKVISFTDGSIRDIWAGENQTIIINTKGEIYGFGNILNGKLEHTLNPVKIAFGNNYMLILTADNKVVEYNGNTLKQYTGLGRIVDIDISNENNIAQTVDERVYTWNYGNEPAIDELEHIYTIASGENNNYVILTDGTVYAKGQNQYGQLGNSTRVDSLNEFTLVGDRQFKIEPESKILYVNDVEDLTEEIQVKEFNVFNKSIRNGDEYTWESSNTDIVTVNNGTITAVAEGSSDITVTDNVTSEEITVTRVVIPVDKDRIESISVNNYEASISGEYEYYVEVETNDDIGTLSIKTKDKTDKISIDNGITWFENGSLVDEIDIINEQTDFTILVQTTNGTQISYKLKIKKISTDVGLESISVDGIEAIPISSTEYEIVVPETTILSEIIARAHNSKSSVSINGEILIPWKSIATVDYGNSLELNIPIIVQAENKDELEYTLTIYKESEALELESLTVDGKDAIRTSETVYSATVSRNLDSVQVIAKAISELVDVSINNEISEVQTSIKEIIISEEVTEVSIRLSTNIEDVEVYRDYKLNIYKKEESGKIQFVVVNGAVVLPNAEGIYEMYLPAETQTAEIGVTTENPLDYIQIDNSNKEQGTNTLNVLTTDDINEYSIIISDEELLNSEKYTLYIKKPSTDNTLKEIRVASIDDIIIAQKSTEEDNVYTAKVKSYNEYQISAITNNINAEVGIGNDNLTKNIATKLIQKTADYMEYSIIVKSENGEELEYLLKIYVMSSDTSLEYITVNNVNAKLQADGSYLVNLNTPETQVIVNAQTTSKLANIKMQNINYDLHTISETVILDSKDTDRSIYVQAEDGTVQNYKLVISGLPDDCTLQKVIVNGIDANYIEGENKYEVRADSKNVQIEAIATDSLASVSINDCEETIGKNILGIVDPNGTPKATIKVKAQNGIDTSIYTLEIKEKSNDASISRVLVNGVSATKDIDGNYKAEITKNTQKVTILADATDIYSTIYLDDVTENDSSITGEKQILDRDNVYTIKVVAEDGTEEAHTLTVTRLEDNVNIQEVLVILDIEETVETIDPNTGETIEQTTIIEKEYTPILQNNGTYYLKLDRVDDVDVEVSAEDVNAKVKIKNSDYVKTENTENVDLVTDKTQVPIFVQSEDGTIKQSDLIIEKKFNDTSIKSITSKDILTQEGTTIYVDEELTQTSLILTTNSSLASIKLENEDTYTPVEITRTIDLSEDAKIDDGEVYGWLVKAFVMAEDGTEYIHTITILKTGNTNIDTLKINNNLITANENTYISRINVASSADVEIKTENENATIEIIKIDLDEEENQNETVVFTGKGILSATLDLLANPQDYVIRIKSSQGSTIKDYNLVIEQKSTEVGISYVNVDDKNAVKTEEGYKATVSGNVSYPVEIKAIDENAFVKISYNDYTSKYSLSKLNEVVPIQEGETLEVTITVKSENGEEEDYKLFITRISDNTELEYIKVDGNQVTNFNSQTNTYSILVDNTLTSSSFEIKSVSDRATITIEGDKANQLFTGNTSLTGPGTRRTLTIEVKAEDGTVEYYYLEIAQLSATTNLSELTVNGENAIRLSYKDYEITISNKTGLAKISAIAQDSSSTISIAGEQAVLSKVNKTYTLNGIDTIQTTLLVTAEDGITSDEYNLTIYVKDANNNIEYVKVNSGIIEPEENTYKVFIENNATTADIEIKAESQYANVQISNKSGLNILSENFNLGVLNFTVATPDDVTTINYSITSQIGETKNYTIVLTKISIDNTLKELYVGNELVNVSEDGNYYFDIENPSELKVKAIANNQYAGVRIDYFEEQLQQTEAKINAQNMSTKVTITVTSQSGVTVKYYLYIRVLANNTLLDKVLVDSVEATLYEDINEYVALVDNNKNDYEVFLMTVNDNATVELFDGDTLLSGGVGNLTELITLNSNEDGHNYKVKVSIDEENYSEYTLKVLRISKDTSVKFIEVNDVVRAPIEEGGFVYQVNVEKQATTAKIRVKTTNNYATLKIGDFDTVINEDTVIVNLNLEEDRTTVPVVVTAVDGTTIDTYNILLLRLSNNADLESVVVNEQVIPNVENVYTYQMNADEFTAHTEISMKLDDNATIQVDDKVGVGYLELDIEFDSNTVRLEKTIKVTSEDGSNKKEYKLVLFKPTHIGGTVITQNYEEKHISNISLHKVGEEEAIQTLTTNEDGTFEIEILEGAEYEIRIEKLGYLCKVITGIKIVPGVVTDVGTHEIFAGDVVVTDEIEIDDLIAITDKFGTIIEVLEGEENEDAIFDLNEDGVVDKLDIDILKANYSKKIETIKWENPNEIENLELTDSVNVIYTGYKQNQTQIIKQDFILPISCNYKITSQYGTRIHPVTGEEKKHTGVDISGTHHTEIYSVADGEVTFAGVQNGFGNCIEIKHVVNGETIYSFYAHLSRIDVEAGQTVSQGQVIGLEGGDPTLDLNPGSSTGHHLHFEIRKATGYGNDINPMDYIKF